MHTLTHDSGKELAKRKQIAEVPEAGIYFTAPYSLWKRGLKDNTNGRIRQYFLKVGI
jgi:IS30 family transposase